MTERLYYVDSYLVEFEATVVDKADEGRRLYLDRSAFYPTSGGQQFDLGSIHPAAAGVTSALPVIDVIDEGERVAHVLGDGPARDLAPGARVVARLDWARRFDHMQQHTGQHLLSALFQEMLGLGTQSVHFGVESSTLDLDAGTLGVEQIQAVEQRANATVFANRAVSVEVEEAGAAEGLRKASARSGPLRVVSIADIDRSACGGTHVRRTGEIGPILIRKRERVRKSTRVEFVCGGRAIRRARADYNALASLGNLLSTSIDGVAEVITLRLDELKRQTAALRGAREEIDTHRAHELYARTSAAGGGGLAIYVEQSPAGALQDMRDVALKYIALPRAVFVGVLGDPPSILLAASEDSGVDAAALLKVALTPAGGRGGGSARVAQGSLENAGALAGVVDAVRQRLG
jgi:alanyl-tRNA synthetase